MTKEEKVFKILQQYTKQTRIDFAWARDSDLGIYLVNSESCSSIYLGELLKNDLKQASKVLSHELGHHYLHRNKIDMKKYSHESEQRDENYSKLIEAEADAFGAGLRAAIRLEWCYFQ
ncbi:MAG: hypothetical protein BI182_15415 [Acetobacterium sp. MES1]|uniref:ImmA/IrrE family metallo-endopeptidase n=1 Tax=Acetobacterium sp. MES1 TaxID=1899015 RepID=UPI000B9D3389|nr:ImmA/IrrE family metallo-endopeptidase [Acetobacterium sp. MES1]OXS25341.1 MAG: hypothetical protein BI182_15415 [Acetobacterium sp. MES1]